METKEYIVRKEAARANTYGLGEVVLPGIILFKAGDYNLTKEELDAAVARTGKRN